MDDHVAGYDLEGDESGFEYEEVVACGDAEGFVDVTTCEADEWGGDWKVGHHF